MEWPFRVGNSPWHEDCLFCSECHTPLSNSCYYKEGRLLCRGDYERRFGVKCGRCGQCLLPHDLVMRTRYSIYHIACFVCTVCGQTLNRGKPMIILIPIYQFSESRFFLNRGLFKLFIKWCDIDLNVTR